MDWNAPLDYGETRHISPDGRTGLRLSLIYDPRDIHESGGYYPPVVYDLQTSACVLSLAGLLSNCQWRWEGESVLHIHIRWTDIIIDLPRQTYATHHDSWKPHPIADAQRRVPDLVEPPPPPIVQSVNRVRDSIYGPFESLKTWLSVTILFILTPAAIGWILWTKVQDWNDVSQQRALEQQITAWVVRCSGDDRFIPMSLDGNGRLSVPRWLSPEPLSPDARVDGLYKSGNVSVRIDGHDVAMSRGMTMSGCTSAR